jgi:hypothetical protein
LALARCGLAKGFLAAVSFTGVYPVIDINISFWPADTFFGFLGGLAERRAQDSRNRRPTRRRMDHPPFSERLMRVTISSQARSSLAG